MPHSAPPSRQTSHTSRATSSPLVALATLLVGVSASFAQPSAIAAPRPSPPASATSSQAKAPTQRSGSPAAGASPAAAATDYNVRVTAQSMRYDDQKHFLTLDGNVVFTHLDTQITAPHAEFETDKQIGHFTKGVRITQPGTTMTADKLSAFYAERKAVLTGHVDVVTEKVKAAREGDPAAKKGEPARPGASRSGGSSTSPTTTVPTIMMCNVLEYWWEKLEGDAIGDVRIRQADKRAFSDRAHYVGHDARQVHMYSNVRYERGPDDWLTCEDAVVDLDTNVFTGNGNVEAYVRLQQAGGAASAPVTPQGDRVLKPRPPIAPGTRRLSPPTPSPDTAAGPSVPARDTSSSEPRRP